MTQVYIVSGISYTIPSDWSSSNSIEAIGGGQTGAVIAGKGAAGGAGAYYCKVSNETHSPGDTITIAIGAGAATGGDTSWQASPTVLAPGGGSATTAVGTVKNAGGAGGAADPLANSGGGGGGAGGPNGAGKAGGASLAVSGGGGGGGAGGGSSTAGSPGVTCTGAGGQGGTAQDGTVGGGPGTPGAPGTRGAGGGGSYTTGGNLTGAHGGNGIEWDVSHGAGGGGGGGGFDNTTGGAGGLYGGGGGGGQGVICCGTGTGGLGKQGILVVSYVSNTPYAPWIMAWAEPVVKTPRGLQNYLYPAFQANGRLTPVEPEPVTESRWHQPWSEPLHRLPGLNAALQSSMDSIVIQPLLARQVMTNSIYRTRVLGLNKPTV